MSNSLGAKRLSWSRHTHSVVLGSLRPFGLWPIRLLYMGFSRQEYWSGLPSPSPGDLPDPEIKPRSPTLQADSLPSEPPGKPRNWVKSSQLEVLPLRLGYNPFLLKLVSGEDSALCWLLCRTNATECQKIKPALFSLSQCCRKESGAGEGDHVPGLTRVHVTAAEYGFLASAVKNSRASHSKVKEGLFREKHSL